MDDLFATVDAAMQSHSPGDTLGLLARELREMGRYDLLFEARGMAKRLELGLPLIQTEPTSSLPEQIRADYEETVIKAARESGQLYLEAGNIPAAYRFLRAIGETEGVVRAIETAEPEEDAEDVIAIAFQEGVHPSKGLELILRRHGMCRAITAFGMHAVEKDREQCMALLVEALHNEIVTRMRHAIEQQEGAAPDTASLPELMQGRNWLFGEYDYYVDTSHLTSVIPYCMETRREDTLRLLNELCEYGEQLSPNFAFRGQPPFDDGYVDYGHYIRAVLGHNTDEHLEHFRRKAAAADPENDGTEAAQLLVSLLSRLQRHQEALEVFNKYLTGEEPAYLRCPNAMQLSFAASNYEALRSTARERGDVLSYTAARLLSSQRRS